MSVYLSFTTLCQYEKLVCFSEPMRSTVNKPPAAVRPDPRQAAAAAASAAAQKQKLLQKQAAAKQAQQLKPISKAPQVQYMITHSGLGLFCTSLF